jgi:general secretion pathway protein A
MGPGGRAIGQDPFQGASTARLNLAIAMFLEAFGLSRDPFLDTADPAFYYDTLFGAHGRRRLVECLAQGRGLAVVVGPIGAGKTTLFNAVQQELLADDRAIVGSILDPTFTSESEFLTAVADAFGFDVDPEAPPRAIRDAIKRALFDVASSQRQSILFIDEAQLLPETLFEPLRALLNYQVDDRKLLCIAMSGQMELAAAVLRHPNFSDRVALWIELGPLSEVEAAGLLHHRLRCAGYSADRSPFDDEALHVLWSHSAGIPRRLTTLARESMEVAAEYSRREVRTAEVESALKRIVPRSIGGDRSSLPRQTSPHQPAAASPRQWWQWWRSAS